MAVIWKILVRVEDDDDGEWSGCGRSMFPWMGRIVVVLAVAVVVVQRILVREGDDDDNNTG